MQQTKPVLSAINAKLGEMTKMQGKIAKYVLKNPQQVVKMTISDFAAVTGNKSDSAIVRFYKVLGFSGYHEFKVSLATEIAGKSFYHTSVELSDSDSVHEVKEKIYNGLIKTLHDNYDLIRDDLLEQACRAYDQFEKDHFSRVRLFGKPLQHRGLQVYAPGP